MKFADRRHAGRRLAQALGAYRTAQHLVVLGIAPGGVPVGAEVARALGAPLDVLIVRKLPLPWLREVPVGALAPDGLVTVDQPAAATFGLSSLQVDGMARQQLPELLSQARRVRAGRPALTLRDQVAIVVDDGISTGLTMTSAVRYVRRRGAARVVVAVPVAPPGALNRFDGEADDLVALERPPTFSSIAEHYESYRMVSDQEGAALLEGAA